MKRILYILLLAGFAFILMHSQENYNGASVIIDGNKAGPDTKTGKNENVSADGVGVNISPTQKLFQ